MMTPELLISEGRRLQRPSIFLRAQGPGPIAARWYEPDWTEIDAKKERCWLTVDASQIPSLPSSVTGYISLFTDEEHLESGRIEVSDSWPNHPGTELYAQPHSVLPPVEAVFACGSDVVGEWIRRFGWERDIRYNDNFGDSDIVACYDQVRMKEFPIYFESDVYAILGGWHCPMADEDWHDLIHSTLMILTLRDSEPWVEAWFTHDGDFKVIQRIT